MTEKVFYRTETVVISFKGIVAEYLARQEVDFTFHSVRSYDVDDIVDTDEEYIV